LIILDFGFSFFALRLGAIQGATPIRQHDARSMPGKCLAMPLCISPRMPADAETMQV